MPQVKFQDPNIEKYILASFLNGPEYWKDIPEFWFNEKIHQKTYKEFKKLLKPPYSTFPTFNIVIDKAEDTDVKLFVTELQSIDVNLKEANIKVQDLFNMYCTRKVYDIAAQLPDEIEKIKIEELIRNKIATLSELLNPYSKGGVYREFIHDSAVDRWLYYKGVESGEIENTALPFHIKELDDYTKGGLRKSHMMLLVAATGEFKCVEENSILTDVKSGIQYTIKQIVNDKKPISMLGINQNTLDTITVTPNDFVFSGKQEVFEILLRSGRKLSVPYHHPFFTSDLKWTKVKNLNINLHRIAIPRTYPFPAPGYLQRVETYKIKLLAYMLAEGNLKGMTFTNTDAEILDDFKNCVSLMGDKVRTLLKFSELRITRVQESDFDYFKIINKFKEEVFKKFKTYKEFAEVSGKGQNFIQNALKKVPRVRQGSLRDACINSNISYEKIDPDNALGYRGSRTRQWFNQIHLKFNTSPKKELPNLIFQLSEEDLSLFLSTLWSCDGQVTNQGVYQYCSSSEILIYQLQHLLLRLSIFSKVSKVNSSYKDNSGKKKYFISYSLCIRDRNSKFLFHKKIGNFLISYKKEKSKKLVMNLKNSLPNPNLDVIPYLSVLTLVPKKDIFEALEKAGFSKRFNLSKPTTKGFSRFFLTKLLPYFNEEHQKKLQILLTENIYWDTVVSIKSEGIKNTYDLSIPQYHNYTANDIYVHNTLTKSSLAYNSAFINKKDTMVLTLEVPGSGDQRDYQMMIDARHSLLDFSEIVNGKLGLNRSIYREKLMDIKDQKYPLYIVDIPERATTGNVIQELELYYAKTGKYPEMLFIDYLNEMEPMEGYEGGISGKFKQIGSELRVINRVYGIRTVTSMQLNREGKKIKDGEKRDVENISESHYIANPFHVIIFLHRDANGIDEATNQLHWTIRKNRYGKKNVTFTTFANAPFCYVGDKKVIYPGYEQ